MKHAIALTLAAVLLTGCVATNRVKPGEAAKAPPSRSMVIVGLSRAPAADQYFTIDIRGFDTATGEIVTAPLDPDKPRRATVIAFVDSFDGEFRFQAYALEPGSYAIASIHAGAGVAPRGYAPASGAPATPGTGWIGLGVSAMASLAAAARQLPPAETLYVDGTRLLDNAPRFDLKPGEVVYLGDLLFGTEFRILESTHPAGQAGASGGGAEPERRHDRRQFVEYGQEPDGARAFAREINLADRPLRVATLRLFAEDKSYAFLGHYLPVDALGAKVIDGPTIHRAPRIAAAGG